MSATQPPIPDEIRQRVETAFDRHKRGDRAAAARVYQEVLARYPNEPRALHYMGLLAQQSGNAEQAIQMLTRSIEIDPTDPRAHNHLGLIHIRANDNRAATACFERGLDVDPDHVESLNSLANAVKTRDLLRAISLYRRALALRPDAPFLAYNLAQALEDDHHFDEALDLYRRTIALDARHFQARHNLGVLLEQRGQFADALEQYLAVQRIDPRHISSLANALGIRDFVPDAAMVRRAEEILRSTAASDDDRIKLHRGLGKHYERNHAYEPAFAHFAQAKALFRRTRPSFNLQAAANGMARIRQVFDRGFFARDVAPVSESERPVFIVGLPRSGTTLTEQILASHPQVFGAGELEDVPKLVRALRPDYPESTPALDGDALEAMANGYLRTIDRLAPADALRVMDKMPVNSLHLGLIATLFPNARIIYCRRDPMDIALSCYFEIFQLEHDFTTDFEDFGRYFLEHEALMAHWRAVLPNPFHEVRYEDLIADTEQASRALVDFCGLDWDAACLEFQKTERTVQTPSRWQVRQPIYQSSIGRWRHYASHMAPLGDLLSASGYDYTRSASGDAARVPAAPRDATTPAALERPIFIVAAPRSGSTLLFETLARSSHLRTLGGEAHWLVENLPDLRPGAPGVASNRLTALQATDTVRDFVRRQICGHLVDNTGAPAPADTGVFLEKTPKNALRIPFFDSLFPGARFVFLWRDPRENISSIMEAWRSGRFVTYRKLPGFAQPWSLLLPPGYEAHAGSPIEEIAAFQWERTNRIVLDDLAALAPERWLGVDYADLVADPVATVKRILDFVEVPFDPALAEHLRQPLPHSRYTQSAPAAEKWRANEAAIARVLPAASEIWGRLRALR